MLPVAEIVVELNDADRFRTWKHLCKRLYKTQEGKTMVSERIDMSNKRARGRRKIRPDFPKDKNVQLEPRGDGRRTLRRAIIDY